MSTALPPEHPAADHHPEPAGEGPEAARPDGGRGAAVALRYADHDSAPRVVAKGYGVLADTILRTAREHGLYVHESPELLGLLMQVDLDSRIPPALYQSVAELLAWLYRLEAADAAADSAGHPIKTTI